MGWEDVAAGDTGLVKGKIVSKCTTSRDMKIF